MSKFDKIIKSINYLDEYQQKQLIVILISKMLTNESFKDAFNLTNINWFDDKDIITDKNALNEALKYF